jgi:hypothetical protein
MKKHNPFTKRNMRLGVRRLALLTWAAAISCLAGTAHAQLVNQLTNTAAGAWSYSELLVADPNPTTYYPTSTNEFATAIFQGYVTESDEGSTGPVIYSLEQNLGYQILQTWIESAVTTNLSLAFNGDDGHSLFVDGQFYGGGGYGVAESNTLALVAGVPRQLTLAIYNSIGAWAGYIGLGPWTDYTEANWGNLLEVTPGIQINANGFPPVQTQTVQFVFISKGIDYMQTNNGPAVVNPQAPGPLYGGPYSFAVSVSGNNIADIPAPALALAPGSTFDDPQNFDGYLTYNADWDEWVFGLVNSNNWGAVSQADMDSLFANGAYQLTVQGITLNLNLTGNAYPAAPVATLTGGTWFEGSYLLDAANSLTVTTSFAGYGSNIDGAILLYLDGEDLLFSLHSVAPNSSSISYTFPSNTLTAGTGHDLTIEFDAIVSSDPSLTNSDNYAGYAATTDINIITRPQINALRTGANTQEITFSGVLQQSTDLVQWTDVAPQPASPWRVMISNTNLFFRVRSN